MAGKYEDGCLLGCSALMMEAARTSEMLVNFYQTTQCHNPEDDHLQTRILLGSFNGKVRFSNQQQETTVYIKLVMTMR
jgi:hypothetical protein